MQALFKEGQDRRAGVTAITLPKQAVLGTRVNHDFKPLAKILKHSKYLGAVKQKHVVVRHAMHDQERAP